MKTKEGKKTNKNIHFNNSTMYKTLFKKRKKTTRKVNKQVTEWIKKYLNNQNEEKKKWRAKKLNKIHKKNELQKGKTKINKLINW